MNKRVEGCCELVVVTVVVLLLVLVVGILSSLSKSALNTWLRVKWIRRLRFVRLRARKGFNEDEDDVKKIGNDNGWVSSVDIVDVGWFISAFIDYYLER